MLEIIHVLGGPGSGKGSVCDYLKTKYGFIHISVGELLRNEIDNQTQIGKKIGKTVNNGDIISPDDTINILTKELLEYDNKTILIDGYPRDINNYYKFQEYLKDNIKEKMVIYLKCTEENMIKRVQNRSNRTDDNSIINRINIFNNKTLKVISEYKKLILIDCDKNLYDVLNDIDNVINENIG